LALENKKKELPKEMNKATQPPTSFIRDFSEGFGNCGLMIPYQYVNWAYKNLGMEYEVFVGDMFIVNISYI
jgi:hypothetical protein